MDTGCNPKRAQASGNLPTFAPGAGEIPAIPQAAARNRPPQPTSRSSGGDSGRRIIQINDTELLLRARIERSMSVAREITRDHENENRRWKRMRGLRRRTEISGRMSWGKPYCFRRLQVRGAMFTRCRVPKDGVDRGVRQWRRQLVEAARPAIKREWKSRRLPLSLANFNWFLA